MRIKLKGSLQTTRPPWSPRALWIRPLAGAGLPLAPATPKHWALTGTLSAKRGPGWDPMVPGRLWEGHPHPLWPDTGLLLGTHTHPDRGPDVLNGITEALPRKTARVLAQRDKQGGPKAIRVWQRQPARLSFLSPCATWSTVGVITLDGSRILEQARLYKVRIVALYKQTGIWKFRRSSIICNES